MFDLKRMVIVCRDAHKKHLLASNTLVTVALLGAGDVFTQYLEFKINSTNSAKYHINQKDQQVIKVTHTSNMPKRTNSSACKVVTLDKYIERSFANSYDWQRSAKLAALGLAIGPLCHYWYIMLDRKFPKKTMLHIIRKVSLDQLVCAPFINAFSIGFISLFDGAQSLREVFDLLKEKFLTVYAYDCAVWPLAQAINFNFISPVYRLVYINGISLVWNSILSFLMFD